MTWGAHGSQTIDLWYRLSQEVITPTQLLATGTACATIRYSPPLTMEPLPGSDDQWMLSAITKLEATTPDGGYVPGPVQDRILQAASPALGQDLVQSFLFPWEFYVLGQQYLTRLKEIQPPADAPLEQRMIWAVDAAWWINMMLAATNIYPSWLTPALTSLLDPNWVQGPYVAPERDAELADVVPFSSLGLDSVTDSWPYPVPFARNPGEFNTDGLLRNQGAFSTSEFARVKHFARQQPWRDGLRLQGDARTQQVDPNGNAGVLIAIAQHAFFRPYIGGGTFGIAKDFFGTIDDIKLSTTKLARFNTA